MEKELRGQRASRGGPEPDLFLQWGNRKRLRRVKARGGGAAGRSDGQRRVTRVTCRVIRGADKEQPSPPSHPTPLHHQRYQQKDAAFRVFLIKIRRPMSRFLGRRSESAGSESRKTSRSVSSSPEKEDRFYTTRGSAAACDENGNGNGNGNGNSNGFGGEDKALMALPRFFLSLSNKEKEEDFMAMKGCKLPQRPKKRSKFIQKSILSVSPGAWLTDLSQERYEVREKKNSRKRRRGLKAMCMESDSD